jgi:cation transport regulator ChaC
MAQRCPGAKLIGSAQLANHRLCFPRRSPVRGCAVASFEPHKGGVIWGVVYELDDDDIRRLDEREGFDPVNPSAINRYCRVDVMVQRSTGERLEAVAYLAVPEENPGRPSADYMKHIIDGAMAHSFPDDYIETLRAIAVAEDGVSSTASPARLRQSVAEGRE